MTPDGRCLRLDRDVSPISFSLSPLFLLGFTVRSALSLVYWEYVCKDAGEKRMDLIIIIRSYGMHKEIGELPSETLYGSTLIGIFPQQKKKRS